MKTIYRKKGNTYYRVEYFTEPKVRIVTKVCVLSLRDVSIYKCEVSDSFFEEINMNEKITKSEFNQQLKGAVTLIKG